MSSGGPENPRTSTSWEKYERFDNSEDEDEIQNDVFSIRTSNLAAVTRPRQNFKARNNPNPTQINIHCAKYVKPSSDKALTN